MGQNRIPEVPAGNGLGLNGNVSVINGRPTRACTFKMTPAVLALRVCKSEGGKRIVTNLGAKDVSWPKVSSGGLGAKDVSWPKVSSGGPEIITQSGGPVKAHPVFSSLALKGSFVKPGKASFDGQSLWARGESSSGITETVSGSPVPTTVPVSSMEGFGLPVASAAPASATEGSDLGFSGVEVRNRRLRDVIHTPIVGVLRGGAMARPMGPGFDAQNSFSPLSCLGSEEDLCFGVRDDTTVVSGDKGVERSNPNAEPGSLSHFDGVELSQVGPENLMIQWKNCEVNSCGHLHGEDKDGFLECSPLSKWDPNDQKVLEVIQEGDEDEFQGLAVKNSKWVCRQMKIFCNIVGFPIVKYEDQCLALFRLLEQDCVDVVSAGSSEGIVNSKQKGMRELKGLFSSINYDGVASKGRNKDFSVGAGAITSFK